MSSPEMTIEEAAQRLVGALLAQFADLDDHDPIPVRLLFEQLAEICNVRDFDSSVLPESESVGWLRMRSRHALTALAEDESVP